MFRKEIITKYLCQAMGPVAKKYFYGFLDLFRLSGGAREKFLILESRVNYVKNATSEKVKKTWLRIVSGTYLTRLKTRGQIERRKWTKAIKMFSHANEKNCVIYIYINYVDDGEFKTFILLLKIIRE